MSTKPDFVIAWTEPESAANSDYQPVYPYNNVTQTKGGHSLELDDTPTRERVRLQHGKGTFIEMHPSGDEVHKIIGDGYEIILKDKNMSVSGKLNITVEGDCNLWVQGDKIEQVDGSVEQYIKGDFTQIVEGLHTTSSFGNMRINAGAGALGKLVINVPDHVRLNGDLNTTGEITADKIMATTRVDAGTGMSAGFLGFVTLTGGVSVGLPVAVPTMINAAGPINSLTSISAPLGTFGISGSILGFDVINLLLHNFHIHPAPRGVTGPPIPKEIGA
jgi:hypothetical protein